MDELRQILGFIFMIFSIALKAAISTTNSVSFSSFSLVSNRIFSVDTVWRGDASPSNVFVYPITTVFVHVPVPALPRCVPADYNSTFLKPSANAHIELNLAHGTECAQRDSSFILGGAATNPLRKHHLPHGLARLFRRFGILLLWIFRLPQSVLVFLWRCTLVLSFIHGRIRESWLLYAAFYELWDALVRWNLRKISFVLMRRTTRMRERLAWHIRCKCPCVPYYIKMPIISHFSLADATVGVYWYIVDEMNFPRNDKLPPVDGMIEYCFGIHLPKVSLIVLGIDLLLDPEPFIVFRKLFEYLFTYGEVNMDFKEFPSHQDLVTLMQEG